MPDNYTPGAAEWECLDGDDEHLPPAPFSLPQRPLCKGVSPVGNYLCGQGTGHPGPHEAYGTRKILARWAR